MSLNIQNNVYIKRNSNLTYYKTHEPIQIQEYNCDKIIPILANIYNTYIIQKPYNITTYNTYNNTINDIIKYFKFPYNKIYKYELVDSTIVSSNNDIITILLQLNIYKKNVNKNTFLADYIYNKTDTTLYTNKNIIVKFNQHDIDTTQLINIITTTINDLYFSDYYIIDTIFDTTNNLLFFNNNKLFLKIGTNIINIKSCLYPQQKVQLYDNTTNNIIFKSINNLITKNLLAYKEIKQIGKNTNEFYESLLSYTNMIFIDNIIPIHKKDRFKGINNEQILNNTFSNKKCKINYLNYITMFYNDIIPITNNIGNEYVDNVYRYDMTNVEGDLIIYFINCLTNKKYKYYVKYLITFDYIINNLISVNRLNETLYERQITNNIIIETYSDKNTVQVS